MHSSAFGSTALPFELSLTTRRKSFEVLKKEKINKLGIKIPKEY